MTTGIFTLYIFGLRFLFFYRLLLPAHLKFLCFLAQIINPGLRDII